MRQAGRKIKRRSAIVLIFAVIGIAGALLFISPRQEKLYTVTVLPTLGGKLTLPCAINDNGQIVGFAETADGKDHIFLWDRRKGMHDLGPIDLTDLDINNAGQIAGMMQDPNGNMLAFLWDPNEGKQTLGTLGGKESFACDLNNRGQVVGVSDTIDGNMLAFIWDKANGMRRLSGQSSMAHTINDNGQVLGSIMPLNANPVSQPQSCFWDSTDAIEAVSLPEPNVYPGGSDLNNRGYVLGRMFHWDKLRFWVYLWRKDTGHQWLFELERAAGSQYLNDANQVLYGEKNYSSLWRISSKLFPPHSQYYLWDPQRGRIHLNGCVNSSTGELLSVVGLNNKGCIIGSIQQQSGEHTQAVLFEPIPERWEK